MMEIGRGRRDAGERAELDNCDRPLRLFRCAHRLDPVPKRRDAREGSQAPRIARGWNAAPHPFQRLGPAK